MAPKPISDGKEYRITQNDAPKIEKYYRRIQKISQLFLFF
jgi:hypothetical protein